MKKQLEELIKKEKLIVNIDEACEIPLPVILSNVNMHCTRSSGTAIEAAVFGIPTLILDCLGENYFKDLILAGKVIVTFSYDSQGYLDGLSKLTTMTISKEELNKPSVEMLKKCVN